MFRKSLLIIRDEKWLLRLPRQSLWHSSVTSHYPYITFFPWVECSPSAIQSIHRDGDGLKAPFISESAATWHFVHGDWHDKRNSTIERALISRWILEWIAGWWVTDGNDFGQYSERSTELAERCCISISPGGTTSWTVDHEMISKSNIESFQSALNLFQPSKNLLETELIFGDFIWTESRIFTVIFTDR